MHMCIQHMCIKTSIFFRSKCIDPSTNCVKCFSNLTCGTFLCSFEKHMLQKVRYAIICGMLISRACLYPTTNCYRVYCIYGFKYYSYSVFICMCMYHGVPPVKSITVFHLIVFPLFQFYNLILLHS